MNKILRAIKFVWKNNKVWLLVTSITMVLILAVSIIVTQNFLIRNTFNTLFGGERRVLAAGDPSLYQYFTPDNDDFLYFKPSGEIKSKNDALKEANTLNEKIVDEGIVLLKNETVGTAAALPLSQNSKISVFGKNSVDLVYGGSGSGMRASDSAKTLYASLESAGFIINPELKAFYENKNASGRGRGKNPDMGEIPAGLVTGETPQASYTSVVKESYGKYNDAALIVISRIGGEGFDLPRTMKTSFEPNAVAVTGANADDHYLQLDKNEKALMTEVSAKFEKVILIINCSTSMELGFLNNAAYGIDAALWIGSPGGTGVQSLVNVLAGSVNPSGRLVDTFVSDFKKDPTWVNFSNNNITNGNRYLQGGAGANAYFVEYEESIYVGYRYWETRAYYEDDDWYKKNVEFPFGYGLSYTTFDWTIIDSVPEDFNTLSKNDEISVTVKVKNTGLAAGRDVVQLYYSAPYYDDEIEKSHIVLGDFTKTKIIQPGQTDTVTLKLKVSDMASYDYNNANGMLGTGYELDSGEYYLYISRNAHDWADSALPLTFFIDAAISFGTDPVTGNEVKNRFDNVSSHISKYFSRANWASTFPAIPTLQERNVSVEFINSLTYAKNDENMPWYTTNMPTFGAAPAQGSKEYKLYDVIKRDEVTGEISVDYNDSIFEELINRLTIEEMAYLIGSGNFNTNYIKSIDKPKTTDPDGPAGFTNFMEVGVPTVYDTCFFASECVIAATWNKMLVHDMGVMIGIEGIFGNVRGDGRPYSGWYAPAMNIHRSPFSGRNFEYYSEDPFLSGIIGAYVVKGAKTKGVYTYVKHFAVNDQETNRDTNGLITWLSEQALREIYLKPFEITVKQGKTTAIMSSFNRIGTVWAGGSYELMTEILRNEWGFKGMVISDYNLYDHMPADQMIRAGGDLNLTQNRQPTTTPNELTATQVSAIRRATKNILYTVAGSNAMNGMGEGVVWRYAMPMWQLLLIWANIALLAGFAVWGFFSIRKKYKSLKTTNN